MHARTRSAHYRNLVYRVYPKLLSGVYERDTLVLGCVLPPKAGFSDRHFWLPFMPLLKIAVKFF